MKPICFPSTYVSDSVAQALTACFGQFIVYQPLAGKIPEQMRPWVEKGFLDIRVPLNEDQADLETVAENFLSWANIHFEFQSFLKTDRFQFQIIPDGIYLIIETG